MAVAFSATDGRFEAGTPEQLVSLGPAGVNAVDNLHRPDSDRERFMVMTEFEDADPGPLHVIVN
jgi:hypothetical protein